MEDLGSDRRIILNISYRKSVKWIGNGFTWYKMEISYGIQ